MIHQAYIALGSNLDNPLGQVKSAVQELELMPDSRVAAVSHWYLSTPMGPVEQPDFINGVALLETALTARQLLAQMQDIERRHQRRRGQHWGPRTLDLDLLLYADHVIAEPGLSVPHPGLRQRNFVLYPLADISPQLTLPSGESLASLLSLCPSAGLTRLEDNAGESRG